MKKTSMKLLALLLALCMVLPLFSAAARTGAFADVPAAAWFASPVEWAQSIGLVSGFAKTAMQWATKLGVMNGDNLGLLNPQSSATRAEVAAMLIVSESPPRKRR